MGSGLVGLHMEVTLIGQSFTVSRNWLTWGGEQSPKSARSQDSKAPEQKYMFNAGFPEFEYVLSSVSHGLGRITLCQKTRALIMQQPYWIVVRISAKSRVQSRCSIKDRH